MSPFVFWQDERDRIERPEAFGTAGIAIDVVGNGVGADDLLSGLPATVKLAAAHRFQGVAKLVPVRPRLAVRTLVFVPEALLRSVFPTGNFGFFLR